MRLVRHALATMKQWLEALEATVAQDGRSPRSSVSSARREHTWNSTANAPGTRRAPHRHPYGLYIPVEDIDHSRTRTKAREHAGFTSQVGARNPRVLHRLSDQVLALTPEP